jgi:periplasmic divalent cation tolerance protein
MGEIRVVLITCGNRAEARRLGRVLVRERLAACVNILVMPVDSIYQWKEKVVEAREFLLLAKTTRGRFAALRKRVMELHSYVVPEVIALKVEAGLTEYLRWIEDSVK